VLGLLAVALDLKAEAKDGVAKFEKLPVGTYQIHAGNLRADVKVEKDKPTDVELK
jgi:hypothetical protein